MTRILRPLTVVAATIIATAGLAACGSAAPVPSGPSGSAGPSAGNLIANLPDLGFRNVKTETAAARGSVITAAGGTITATGSNGAVYALVIPRDAMPSTTQIAIYPISSAANLPGGAKVAAGVQITPDGIQLRTPATFTIHLPTGTNTKGLGGLLWTGDAEKVHPYPVSIQGQTVTMHLSHFTAPAVTPNPVPLVGLGACANESDMDSWVGSALTVSGPGEPGSSLSDALRTCYRDYVAPATQNAVTHPLDSTIAGRGISAFYQWTYALVDAASAVGSEAFTVAPEAEDAKALAVTMIKAIYDAWNQACVDHKDDPDVDVPITDANFAMLYGWATPNALGLNTAANGLDHQGLLDRLCVQVVIDPSPSYAATGPGKTGDVDVHVGFTIAGGQLRSQETHITLTRTGTGVTLVDGETDAQGNFAAAVTWPTGVDPIQIDVVAELDITVVLRFERITKYSVGSGTGPGGGNPPTAPGPTPGMRVYGGTWQFCDRAGVCLPNTQVQGAIRFFQSSVGDWVLQVGCLPGTLTGQYTFRFFGDPASFTASGVGSPPNTCSSTPTVKGSRVGTTLTFEVTGITGYPLIKFNGTVSQGTP